MAKAKTTTTETEEAEAPVFECCGQFEEALDPNIKKAYLGYCKGLEWPFTVMVPIGGLGGDCPNPKKKEAIGKP
jgi:hypothetical protein